MGNSLWYPSVEDILALHDDIVSEYPDTHSGVANPGDIEFALNYIKEGSFDTVPETIHEKAFHCSDCSSPTTRSSMPTSERR